MNPTKSYSNPPIVELVLGVQFAPLHQMRAAHLGGIWDGMGRDYWVAAEDEVEIVQQFERFEQAERLRPPIQMRLQHLGSPARMVLRNGLDDRRLQVQKNRFHLNWRHPHLPGGGSYPSYKLLRTDFETSFKRFQSVLQSCKLGETLLNQWELTYIDSFPQGDYWDRVEDWPQVLPGLFSPLFSTQWNGVKLERRSAEWSFEIPDKLGRLHVSAYAGRVLGQSQESLLLNMTARGPLSNRGVVELMERLDLGHEVAVETFERCVSNNARKKWGEAI